MNRGMILIGGIIGIGLISYFLYDNYESNRIVSLGNTSNNTTPTSAVASNETSAVNYNNNIIMSNPPNSLASINAQNNNNILVQQQQSILNTHTNSNGSQYSIATSPNNNPNNLPISQSQPNILVFNPSVSNYPIPAWEGYSVPHIYQWTGKPNEPLYYISSLNQFNSVNTLLNSGQSVPNSIAQQYTEG